MNLRKSKIDCKYLKVKAGVISKMGFIGAKPPKTLQNIS